MTNIQAITPERHATQRWQRFTNYGFTATEALCPLVVQEIPKAMLSLPIGFIEIDDLYVPVAVLGLTPDKNLFVTSDGRWLASYVPTSYRIYPFLLAKTEDGKQVLCINEDSGLLSESEGEPLFDEEGQLSKTVSEIFEMLNQIATNRIVTQRVCAVLQKHDLIQPWPIKLQSDDEEKNLEGLFRVDESKLNQLPAEAFIELRDSGALLLAHCQLLSAQNFPILGKLADAHVHAQAKTSPSSLPSTANGDLDLSFITEGDTFNFGGL